MRNIWNRLIKYCGLTAMVVCLILAGNGITANAANMTDGSYGNVRGLSLDVWEFDPYVADQTDYRICYNGENESVFVFGDMSYYREHVNNRGLEITSPAVSFLESLEPLQEVINMNNRIALNTYVGTDIYFYTIFDVYCVDVVGSSQYLMRAERTTSAFNGQINVVCTDEIMAFYEQCMNWLDLTEEDFDALAVYINADGDVCGYQCLCKDDIDTEDVIESDISQKELVPQIENMIGEKLNINLANSVVKVKGNQSYDAAFALLEELNALRAEEGLPELVMDAELLDAAMLRSAEIILSGGVGRDTPGINYRPTGETCLTASSKIDAEYCFFGENENANYLFMETLDLRMYPDELRYRTAFDSRYTIAGVGCTENDGSWYWTIELGTGEAEPVSKSGVETNVYEIEAQRDKSHFLGTKLEGDLTDTLTAPGQQKKIDVYVMGKMVMDETGKNLTMVWPLVETDSWIWESENEEIATVDANGVVTAVGEGYVMLWGKNPANPDPSVWTGLYVTVDYSAASEEDGGEDTDDSDEDDEDDEEGGGIEEVTIYGSLADTEFQSYFTKDVYLGLEEVNQMVYDMTPKYDVNKTGILVFGDVVNDTKMQEAIGNMWWLAHAGFAYAQKPAFVSTNDVKMFAFDNAGNSEKAVWEKLESLPSHKYNISDCVKVGGYTDSVKAWEDKLRQMLGISEDWSGTLIVYVNPERQVYGYMTDDTDIYRMADWLIAAGVEVQHYDELTWQTVNVTEKKLYSQADKMLEEINYQRSVRGLYPYVVDEELTELAMRRATESLIHMDNYHYRLNGTTALSMSLRIEGENVAQGTGAEAVEMWLRSTAGHREAVLSDYYVSVGIGVVDGASVLLFNTEEPETAYQAGKPDEVETYTYNAIPAFEVCVGNNWENTGDMALAPDSRATIKLWMKDAYVHDTAPFPQTRKTTVDNDSFLWSSSDTEVATVDENGIITAKQLGEAVITGVNIGDYRRTVTVNLTVSESVEQYFDFYWIREPGYVGETVELNRLKAYPEGVETGKLTWTSDNPDVISVDENGTLTLNAEGTATITVTGESGITSSRSYTALKPDPVEQYIEFGWVAESGYVGETIPLSWLSVNPGGVETGKLTWTSSNPDVISVDETGTLTLKAVGMVEITVTTENGITGSRGFMVQQPYIDLGWEKEFGNVGETIPLSWLYVFPEGVETGKLTWTSDNPDVISVDANGTLTLKSEGEAMITVTTETGITCYRFITVMNPDDTDINTDINTYIGNINSELISFDLKQNEKGAYYLTGQIVVVEWVDGKSTVPKDAPTMIFKSTDGSEEIEVFVTPTGTNTYYFDRFIEGLSPNKEYVFEITSGTESNISPNRSMNVLLSTSPQIVPIKNLGKIGEQKISYYQADNGELRLHRQQSEYIGHINSELIKTELVKGPNGNYVSGQIVVVEWVNDVSTVPLETPIMYFKSTDGLESLPVFITPTGTNTYYFDRSLGDVDTSKEYVFTIESGDAMNVSPYRSMIVTTAAMENKTGTLWESDTQYVRYRTDANTAELRIYAVNK